MAIRFDPAVIERLDADRVGWLTTVTDGGAPSPTPVWFVRDGDTIVTYCEPAARKAANVRARPAVTFHLNSDADGQDVLVVHAGAVAEDDRRPSEQPGHLDEYRDGLAIWGLTADEFDAGTTTRLRLVPTRVWLGPDA